MAAAVTVFFAMRDAAVDVDTVGELARVLGPYQASQMGGVYDVVEISMISHFA